jgi:TonB family protein
MSRNHTHYDNLKVSRNAPPEVIRAAYKALSQRYHPDKNSSPDATRIMKILNEAYEVLGDPERRQLYDARLNVDSEHTAHTSEQATSGKNSDEAPPRPEPQTDGTTESERPTAATTQPMQRTSTKRRSGWIWIIGIMVAALMRLLATSSHSASNIESAAPAFASDTTSNSQSVVPATMSTAPVPEQPKLITSFDCGKARTASEKLICSDAELASLDLDLATVFAQAKAIASDKRAFGEAARRNWNWRNANCFDKSCLVTWYNDQRERLVAILNQPAQADAVSEPHIIGAAVPAPNQIGAIGTTRSVSTSSDPAPSSFYAERLRRKVRPNIVWAGDTSGLETVIAVRAGRTGTLLSATISRSSGNSQWDAAALRAVERSDPFPLDVNGEAPASFTITLSPRGDGAAPVPSGREQAIAWSHAMTLQHPDADGAYESAQQNLVRIQVACPDAILLRQTPHRPSEFRPVVMFLSQHCGFIASYWPESNEEQSSFDPVMIENWRGYCASGGASKTFCSRGNGA